MATYLTDAELARLERLAGEAKKPEAQRTLTEEDLDEAAFLSRKLDANGEAPLNADGSANASYTNTVDIYRAASFAWNMKAAIYAEEFEFEADGGLFKRNQKYDMAIAQAKRYADMSTGSVPIAPEERA